MGQGKNAEAPEEVLTSHEIKETMEWAGNTPPIMCIVKSETDHAYFKNLLTSRGHARAKNKIKHENLKQQQKASLVPGLSRFYKTRL